MLAHSRDLREKKKKRNIETMSGPDLCRPRQQTFFKIVGLFCVVVFVLFFLFFPLFLSPCGGTLMISEEKSKTKQNKNNNQVKPCLGQTCAGRGSRPLSKSLVLLLFFFCFFLFVPESVWWHTHGGPCLEKLVYGRILLEGGPSSRKACLEKLSLSAWAQ